VKKIIFALAVLVLIIAVGCATTQQGNAIYQEKPAAYQEPPTYLGLNTCHKACINIGFEQGTCYTIREMPRGGDIVELGPCVIPNSLKCSMPGECTCACYNVPGNVDTKGYY